MVGCWAREVNETTGRQPAKHESRRNLPQVPQEQNYWLTTVEMPKTDLSCVLPETADVAIIGAGFTGLSAARALAQKGVKVVALESETIGWGASSRNGGMVLTGMKLGVNQLISMYGRERTQRMYAASLASIDCVEQIVREESDRVRFLALRTSRGGLQAGAF